jgi:chromosome segregation ATPase
MSVILEELNTASDRFHALKQEHDATLSALQATKNDLANRRGEVELREQRVQDREVQAQRKESQVAAAERLAQEALAQADREKRALVGKQAELDQRLYDLGAREQKLAAVQSEFEGLLKQLAGYRASGPQIMKREP